MNIVWLGLHFPIPNFSISLTIKISAFSSILQARILGQQFYNYFLFLNFTLILVYT